MKRLLQSPLGGSPLAVSVALGFVFGILITAYLGLRPASYQARLVLVAHPVSTAKSTGADYAAVVTSNLPAVVDFVKSRDVATAAAKQVPGADADSLPGRVSAEVVPASSVVRISVIDSTPERAQQLVTAVSGRLADSTFLAGVATLQRIDSGSPSAEKLAPDTRLAIGFGLVGGAAVLVAALAAFRVFSPVLLSRRQVRQVVGDREMPIIALGQQRDYPACLELVRAAGGAKLIPVSNDCVPMVNEFTHAYLPQGVVRDGDEAPWILVASYRGTATHELATALELADRSGHRVLALGML